MKTQDLDKVWHEVQDLQQRESEPIDDYICKFSLTWEWLYRALEPQMASNMMKKDRLLIGLRESLRWRVELKKPQTFEDAVEVAKNKEWKLRGLTQLGMDPSYKRSEVKDMAHTHMHDHHAHMVPIAT